MPIAACYCPECDWDGSWEDCEDQTNCPICGTALQEGPNPDDEIYDESNASTEEEMAEQFEDEDV